MQRLLTVIAVGLFRRKLRFRSRAENHRPQDRQRRQPARPDGMDDRRREHLDRVRPAVSEGRPEAQMMPPGAGMAHRRRRGDDHHDRTSRSSSAQSGWRPGSYTINTVPGDKEWQLVLGRLSEARPVGHPVSEGAGDRPHADEGRQDDKHRSKTSRSRSTTRPAAARCCASNGARRRPRAPFTSASAWSVCGGNGSR